MSFILGLVSMTGCKILISFHLPLEKNIFISKYGLCLYLCLALLKFKRSNDLLTPKSIKMEFGLPISTILIVCTKYKYYF